jgi:hypothetical protein
MRHRPAAPVWTFQQLALSPARTLRRSDRWARDRLAANQLEVSREPHAALSRRAASNADQTAPRRRRDRHDRHDHRQLESGQGRRSAVGEELGAVRRCRATH